MGRDRETETGYAKEMVTDRTRMEWRWGGERGREEKGGEERDRDAKGQRHKEIGAAGL